MLDPHAAAAGHPTEPRLQPVATCRSEPSGRTPTGGNPDPVADALRSLAAVGGDLACGSCPREPDRCCYDGRVSRSQHVWLSAAAVIATVILFWGGAVWWQLGPLGQMATRDDIAQLRAELLAAIEDDERLHEYLRRELRESTPVRASGWSTRSVGWCARLTDSPLRHVTAPALPQEPERTKTSRSSTRAS